MSREIVLKGDEHAKPACHKWEEMQNQRCVSFEWFACCCSPIERDYQLLIGLDWQSVHFCPFCGNEVNPCRTGSIL
jgi:hypothetical protein